MAKMNKSFLNLEENYLFSKISKRVSDFTEKNPDTPIIRMGIGDVTLPLPAAAVAAGKKAFDEMGVKATFRGYEDSGRGYDFLRIAVANYYKSFGADVPADEIFISDGAKSDSGNIGDIFSDDSIVTITDPAYPVYVDSSIMGGKKVQYANSNEKNGFAAMPCDIDPGGQQGEGKGGQKPDIIYLCSPNNPTGSAYTFEQLKTWIDYATENRAIIIYDAAYEAFITQPDKPRSIYQVEGARKCAIEICSLSKTAGFTGTRCGYTVVPKELRLESPEGKEISLFNTWVRRQGSKFNGVSYPVQRAAEAVFSKDGQRQIAENIARYRENATIIANTLTELGIDFTGGINSPYIWFKCPGGINSWDFFDIMLNQANVVGTPGEGFCKNKLSNNGIDRFRLTAFSTKENTEEAMRRFKKLIETKR
ncbi:MAG: LL-diaminopimelate aminotransferase [Oscillospiraceae bacterium]|nr:LL-diaminopimelate aminotransferase [Oscillospiraceae bacterium]